ncbi:MAG: hypothetical protein SFV51_01165 [Bryobacteraceae bacterium]|nr:hypothetical protein [Bryobacteraceae bacterium]
MKALTRAGACTLTGHESETLPAAMLGGRVPLGLMAGILCLALAPEALAQKVLTAVETDIFSPAMRGRTSLGVTPGHAPIDTIRSLLAGQASFRRPLPTTEPTVRAALGGVLTPGLPQSFSLPAVDTSTMFDSPESLYRIEVPSGAKRLQVGIVTDDPAHDVDILMRAGRAPVLTSSEVQADAAGFSAFGLDSAVISAASSPPLAPGPYFVALRLVSRNTAVSGTIHARLSEETFRGVELDDDIPHGFVLPSRPNATLYAGDFGFSILVPTGAERLQVRITTAQTADVDLFVRNNAEPDLSAGRVVADHRSEGLSGDETIVITPSSIPPLRPGRYFIALGNLTRNQRADGLVRATVTGGVRPPVGVRTISEASLGGEAVAPDSLAISLGNQLAVRDEVSTERPLPLILGGSSLQVVDSRNQDGFAQIKSASSARLGWLVPDWVADGPATVRIRNEATVVSTGTVMIARSAPALFSADGSGRGVASAVATRTSSDGATTESPTFRCSSGQCSAVPLDLGSENDRVILKLSATGVRHASRVRLEFQGEATEVMGVQADEARDGVDIVSIVVPRRLFGAGVVDLVLLADDARSNTVTISVGGPGGQLPSSIRAVSPNRVPVGRSATIRIDGGGMAAVTAVEVEPSAGIVVSNLRNSETALTVDLQVSPDAETGNRQLSVISLAGRSNRVSFQVLESPPPGPPQLSNFRVEQRREGAEFVLIYTADFVDPDGDMSLQPAAETTCEGRGAWVFSNSPTPTRNDGLFQGTIRIEKRRTAAVPVGPPITHAVRVRDAGGRSSNLVTRVLSSGDWCN